MTPTQTVSEPVIEVWPSDLELPWSDGKFVENLNENPQSEIVNTAIVPILEQRHPQGDFLYGCNSGIYWKLDRADPLKGAKAPDWYYVPGMNPNVGNRLIRSYIMSPGRPSPFMVMEFVSSDGEEERDITPGSGKFWVYENAIKSLYYIIWDAEREILEGYRLENGKYRPLAENEHNRLVIPEWDIEIGIWYGQYGLPGDRLWMRFWDRLGRLIPNSKEAKIIAQKRSQVEANRADQAEAETKRIKAETKRIKAETKRIKAEQVTQTATQQAAKFAAKLRELGIDPETV